MAVVNKYKHAQIQRLQEVGEDLRVEENDALKPFSS